MRRLLGLLVLAAAASGCSSAPEGKVTRASLEAEGGKPPPQVKARGQAGGAEQGQGADQAPERKVIFTARVELIVDDFDGAEAELLKLVKDRRGYVASSDLQGTPGSPRTGTWTVRVPAATFEDFLDASARLGELRHSATDSQDVTDAYYDLQAHIKNDESREEGLRKLIQSKASTGKLEDLLAIDRELSAVRGKIDTQKGQIQRWDKEVAFSTATITMRDRRGYVPPVQLGFGGTVGKTFSSSLEALVSFGKMLVLAAVAVAPWLAVLAVLGAPLWFGRRRWLRRVSR
jgi:hypothetical protein